MYDAKKFNAIAIRLCKINYSGVILEYKKQTL